METVYILLPVHNRREVTRRFVDCLKEQTWQNYHLVLIDDGSIDETQEMVRSEVSALTVLTGIGDWWWAGALQQGYNWLRNQEVKEQDLVLIINDDTEFETNFLENAVNLCREHSRSLLLAESSRRGSDSLVGGGVHVDWRSLTFREATTVDEINCLSTRGLFMAVKDFVALGGFFPKLLPHYLSDYEFTIRAQRRGMKLLAVKSLKIWVDEEATGYHQFDDETFKGFLKKYFSKKSDANPFAWTAFIGLACPWRWKLLNWMRVWYGTTVKLIKAFR